MHTDEQTEIFTQEEAARYCGIKIITLRQHVSQKKIRFILKKPKNDQVKGRPMFYYLFAKQDLDIYLATYRANKSYKLSLFRRFDKRNPNYADNLEELYLLLENTDLKGAEIGKRLNLTREAVSLTIKRISYNYQAREKRIKEATALTKAPLWYHMIKYECEDHELQFEPLYRKSKRGWLPLIQHEAALINQKRARLGLLTSAHRTSPYAHIAYAHALVPQDADGYELLFYLLWIERDVAWYMIPTSLVHSGQNIYLPVELEILNSLGECVPSRSPWLPYRGI
jgi:hypothetical protein